MAICYLFLFFTSLLTVLTAPYRDVDDSPSRRQRSTGNGETVRVDFTVVRGDPSNDTFCDHGLDIPGNITIDTFYRERATDGSIGDWTRLQRNSSRLDNSNEMNITLSLPLTGEAVQLAVLQLDHAGLGCQNWGIRIIKNTIHMVHITFPNNTISERVARFRCVDSERSEEGDIIMFKDESGSSLRGFISKWMTNSTLVDCVTGLGNLEEEFFLADISSREVPLCDPDTTPDTPYMDISFLLHWSFTEKECNFMNSVDEGIELSIRRAQDVMWTPLAFFLRDNTTSIPPRPSYDLTYDGGKNITIRGVSVPIFFNKTDTQHHLKFRICNENIVGQPVQFRWLQTAQHFSNGSRDTWSLDDFEVTVTYDAACSDRYIFSDDFNNYQKFPNSVKWPAIRRAQINNDSDICNKGRDGQSAWFGGLPEISPQTRMIASRIISTGREVVCSASMDLNSDLMVIYAQLYTDISSGLAALEDYLRLEGEEVDIAEIVYLTSVILDILGDSPVDRDFSQSFVNIASELISIVNSRNDIMEPLSEAGSQLISNMDQFALRNHQISSGDITSEQLNLTVIRGNGQASTIINQSSSTLTLPSEAFDISRNEVFASSYHYGNMTGFLSNTLSGVDTNNTTLHGPVLSAFIHSNRKQFERNPLQDPVIITFEVPAVNTSKCVFWNFTLDGWDDSGCKTSSTDDIVTCSCNHLTHFAVLLSPDELEADEGVIVSLQVIGIVGVTISLIFLIITIITFIAFRSLWSLRNYIHIQLCVSLVIAQLVFVIGVVPRGNEDGCTAVAVLLHYFWLVCFMWMLMEGAVLYVALVKVFDVHHLKYLIAFTAISYGVPLVYMIVCVPIGLVLTGPDGNNHYGSDEACWLRYDTNFIWAFIAPVIIIILINIGFFVMAMIIMCRHHKSQAHRTRREQTIHWMKASISLLVVMGITWIIGVLVFIETLLPIAYIFTIFAAFQGLVIFIVLVIFSKQVRETYSKWWKMSVVNSEFVSKHFSDWSWSKTAMTSVHSNGRSVSPTNPSKPRSVTDLSTNSSAYFIKPSSNGTTSIADPLTEEPSLADPSTPSQSQETNPSNV